jgi:cytolysin (calcineurin-like family phosphatase)
MRWLYWAPLIVLTVGTGLLALRLGWNAATLTEGDVIEKYGEQYVAAMQLSNPQADATLADCRAVPSMDDDVWIIVICGKASCGLAYSEYHVNRIGGFVRGGDAACSEASLRRKIA